MTTIGTMKVLDIQEKEGYSLATFEIPDDCKQFLIEYAIRDLLTKAANETKEKYGSALPEPEQTVDNNLNKVYNEDKDGWIPNTGVQPVEGWVSVDVLFRCGKSSICSTANEWKWEFNRIDQCDSDYDITHWRLSKQEK